MVTATAKNTATIEETCVARYGVSILAVSDTTALWLAELLTEQTGKNWWKAIASIRRKAGKDICFPEYKSICCWF
jgi:hypothetical protein